MSLLFLVASLCLGFPKVTQQLRKETNSLIKLNCKEISESFS